METTIRGRIEMIKGQYGLRHDANFAEMLDVTPQTVVNWKKRNTWHTGKILGAFPELNREWVIFGSGPMITLDLSKDELKDMVRALSERVAELEKSNSAMFNLINAAFSEKH